ncbi:kinase-like protein [Hortaea werneckii]|nr:kinase-like protein [Hortaea werneckii]KAI7318024.1 kinase-like protein [Hortaea werneckii]
MYRAQAAPSQPAGTFLPGTKVQVGTHRVTIEKYLSEGGFAHVYVVRIPHPSTRQHELAVLKRVAVPDREHLASMRTEVETMKKLKGHKHIVTYIDSHASQLKGGGYEVFLLMEYCGGGGLIDFMNTRLQHRLTEPEILKIFGDCAEGVACMHYLKPPLLHRDLKVENVLINKDAKGTPMYKLCDFGSTAPPRQAAKTAEEGRLIEEDVQKHTTMQYRSPEMIDVWRKQPIDEKADIWALGVLLYKLCYYTTPFEDVGQMAILNASFKYPPYPSFSTRLKTLIGNMLKEDSRRRPNIYEVVKEVCSMRGVPIPIKDIYAGRTQSEDRRNQTLPPAEPAPMANTGSIGLQKQHMGPSQSGQKLPDIQPMRRGRPTAQNSSGPMAAATSQPQPSPSPARGDPFAALDSKNYEVRSGAVDELSKKFPSLDEFSITHDKQDAFNFDGQDAKVQGASQAAREAVNARMTNALADEVFGVKAAEREKSKQGLAKLKEVDVPKSHSTSALQQQGAKPTSPSKPPKPANKPVREDVGRQSPQQTLEQPIPIRAGQVAAAASKYTSTGVGSSPPPVSKLPKMPEVSNRPIWKVPSQHERSSSQPRASDAAQAAASSLQPSVTPSQRPALMDMHRSKSQTAALQAKESATSSSRPSLEGHRPSQLSSMGDGIERARSAQGGRQRPSSAVYVASNMDYLRDQEQQNAAARSSKRPSLEIRRHSRQPSMDRRAGDVTTPTGEGQMIGSDLDFLRSNEEANDYADVKRNRSSGSGHHKKRSSLGNAKNIFAGRFGDAFRRFEGGRGSGEFDARNAAVENEVAAESAGPATPLAQEREEEPRLLSPVPASEASRQSDDDEAGATANFVGIERETEELPPSMKREMERRRASAEEKRQQDASAAYRSLVGSPGPERSGSSGGREGGENLSRASTIQKRVQSLLDEGRQAPTPHRTAEGYGRFTAQPQTQDSPAATPPPVARKPVQLPANQDGASGNPYLKNRQAQQSHQQRSEPPQASVPPPSASAPPMQPPQTQQPASIPQRTVSRPSVPPKSQALRTGSRWPPQANEAEKPQPPKSSGAGGGGGGGGLAALLAKDLEGVPEYPPRGSSMQEHISPEQQQQQQQQQVSAASSRSPPPPQQQSTTSSAELTDTGNEADHQDLLDLETEFSKRYPSLNGIEMVEREISGAPPRSSGGAGAGAGGGARREMTVRDV